MLCFFIPISCQFYGFKIFLHPICVLATKEILQGGEVPGLKAAQARGDNMTDPRDASFAW